MNEAVQTFLTSIKECRHVLKLIEKLNMLTIKFICEQKMIVVAFHNGEIFLLKDNEENSVECEISGQLDSILKLVNGKEKLRNLIRNDQLKVNASFRVILLLESIFYLTDTEAPLTKTFS